MITYSVSTDGSVVLLGHRDATVIFTPVFVRKIEKLKNIKLQLVTKHRGKSGNIKSCNYTVI